MVSTASIITRDFVRDRVEEVLAEGNMVKIDASQPEQRVVNKATTEVLDFINERTIRQN